MTEVKQLPDTSPAEPAPQRRIIAAVVGTTLLAIATLFGLAIWMALVTDKTAAEKSTKIVSNALLSAQVRAESLLTENATLSDLHVWIEKLTAEQYVLMGQTPLTARAFHFFGAYFEIGQDGQLRHAFWKDAATAPVASLSPAETATLLRMAGSPSAAPRTLETGFARLGGRPFLVTVAWMMPPRGEHDGTARHAPHLMVAARIVDAAFLRDKSERYVIEDLTLIPDGRAQDTRLTQMTLRDVSGETVVAIGWRPPRPGQQALVLVAPFITVVALGLVAVNFWIGRSTARQATAFVQAYSLARTDRLTRLMNRAGLEEVATQPAVRAALANGGAAVLYLDLNGFKQINDNLGHAAGDKALQVTAQRILSAVREQDAVARMGGDEFVCLVLEAEPRVAAYHIAQRILEATDHPLRIETTDHFVRPAIGIALAEPDCDLSDLIRMADAAMYHAKTSVTHEIVFYGEEVAPPVDAYPANGNAA